MIEGKAAAIVRDVHYNFHKHNEDVFAVDAGSMPLVGDGAFGDRLDVAAAVGGETTDEEVVNCFEYFCIVITVIDQCPVAARSKRF